MKWSELPQEYRDLEKGFDKIVYTKVDFYIKSEDIGDRFTWFLTPQGEYFWMKCYEAKTIEELPPIPKEIEIKTPIEQLLETISCANCVFNVNSKCKAIGIAIEIHREDSFFCSDHRNVNQLN